MMYAPIEDDGEKLLVDIFLTLLKGQYDEHPDMLLAWPLDEGLRTALVNSGRVNCVYVDGEYYYSLKTEGSEEL